MAAITGRERVQSQSFCRTESGGISKEPALEASQNGKGGVAQFVGLCGICINTVAGMQHNVYRKKFLQQDSLALDLDSEA